jgi:hypothetical protein
MSYDLGIWSSRRALTSKQATEIYVALCPDDFDEVDPDTSLIDPQPDARERISAFLAELTQYYPPPSSLPGDQTERNIWSCDFETSDIHVLLSIRPSCVMVPNGPLRLIQDLAAKHELVLFDPTDDSVILPPSLQSP